ncbi:helix-turn-helix transcriptional regulator [Paenibacillus eucommiae]|uniref:Molybdopterin biosynthesis protein n=1 Tax=Paenibacillus eucommiae TaxID=1355755 RepID=A0ABS4J2H7_9BACL|nr:helix-turn-helix transcriptional regulator [Paenibacillus eucommiae]MBP1994023.1 putative molybdopterin biosynthesis protein [Paenibacillus eucommiae]
MTNQMSYTTEEIAALLKVSKLTVYDLIKKGDLPSYRVGKQMRVDDADLEAYKNKTKSGIAAVQEDPSAYMESKTIVITGQDISLDILTKHIEKNTKNIRPLRSYVGSLDSLISMYKGDSDIVSTHLLDGDSGEYNLPYIRKLLTGFHYVVVNLVIRSAGLFVPKGNPKQIYTWRDLKREGITIVNREKGSGARVLLDEQLRLQGMDTRLLKGYDCERSNHIAVAGMVALGEADVGVGIEKAANIVSGVEFIPMIQERYDLVMIKSPQNMEWIAQVMNILKSEAFLHELTSVQGYDLSLTGTIMYES